MRKTIILLLLLTSLRTTISCCRSEGYDFRWSKISLTNLNVSTDRPVLTTNDTSKIEDYGFRLFFDFERLSKNVLNELSFNKAYAFDCYALYSNKDSIRSIDITTKYDFDNTHPAGSSINDDIVARRSNFYNYTPQDLYRSISDNLRMLNESQDDEIRNNSLDCKFETSSPFLRQHTFLITVNFKSGKTLSDSTSITFN